MARGYSTVEKEGMYRQDKEFIDVMRGVSDMVSYKST